jgi:hypothetical protein
MGEQKPPVIDYARPPNKRRRRNSGELGAIPALVCLLAGAVAVISLACVAGIAAFMADSHQIGGDQAAVAAIAALIGVPSGWLAVWINRKYRKFIPDEPESVVH